MKNEIEINEELVEEIRSEAFKHTIVVLNRETIVVIGKVFLSAVRDGKQKLPGEVGRIYCHDFDGWVRWMGKLYDDGGRIAIALRPEEEK